MFKNAIKTALRSLLKNKGFTFLNIFGLALGLAVCLLIVFYVVDELSYDRYNVKASRIVRINSDMKFGGSTTSYAIAAPAVAAALKDNFPEVENVVRLTPVVNIRFKKGNEEISEEKGVYSDPSIFGIFTLPMIEGDPENALKEPNAVVITENIAKKYFNKSDVVGLTLTSANDNIIHKITGVIRNVPSQSHFNFDFFLSTATLPGINSSDWTNLNYNTYVLFKPGTDYKKFDAKLPAFFNKALGNINFDVAAFEAGGNYYRINFTPLTDIHLQSNRQRELGANSSIQYVYIFSVVGLFILLMACINFINLSTARSSNRAREVGVRKVLGSPRLYLIIQFIWESIMVTLAGIFIAVLVTWGLLPLFSQVSGKDLAITIQTLTWLLPSIFVCILVIGIVAGSYPAFFLSSFRPISVLKGKLSTGFKGGGLRSFLVVFQFTISIFLIISTMVVYNQLHYIQNKDLGFNRNHVLLVKNASALENPKILKREVKQLPGIVNATLSSFFPTGSLRWPQTVSANHNQSSIFAEFWPVDEDYLNTMGMAIVKGRNFSSQFSTDSSSMIVNKTAAEMLSIPKNHLNQTIYYGEKKFHLIGIVKDFNFNSLRDNITPLVLVLSSGGENILGIKLKSENLPALLSQIENKWNTLSPNQHVTILLWTRISMLFTALNNVRAK